MTAGWARPALIAAGALVVAATLVSFVLWGAHGPALLLEMVAAYCF